MKIRQLAAMAACKDAPPPLRRAPAWLWATTWPASAHPEPPRGLWRYLRPLSRAPARSPAHEGVIGANEVTSRRYRGPPRASHARDVRCPRCWQRRDPRRPPAPAHGGRGSPPAVSVAFPADRHGEPRRRCDSACTCANAAKMAALSVGDQEGGWGSRAAAAVAWESVHGSSRSLTSAFQSMHESMPLTWLSSGRNGRQRGCCRRRWRLRPRRPSGRRRWRAPLPSWRCLCARIELVG